MMAERTTPEHKKPGQENGYSLVKNPFPDPEPKKPETRGELPAIQVVPESLLGDVPSK